MAHYYFHVRRGQLTVLDHDGIELANTVDAKAEAAQRAQQIVDGDGASASRRGIIVADHNWQTMFELPF